MDIKFIIIFHCFHHDGVLFFFIFLLLVLFYSHYRIASYLWVFCSFDKYTIFFPLTFHPIKQEEKTSTFISLYFLYIQVPNN